MNLKKVFSLALCGAMTLSLVRPALAAPAGWTPADGARGPAEPWYAEAQAYAEEKGLMTGTDKGFEPELTVNRATVYEMFWKMEGKPMPKAVAVLSNGTWMVDAASSAFQDVVGKWYDLSANWAWEVGLTTGAENSAFNGDRDVTRAELVTVLHRYAQLKGAELPVVEEHAADPVILENDHYVPAWAVEDFYWALQVGLIQGVEGEHSIEYRPNDTATRAQLATILMRFHSQLPAGEDTFTCSAVAISKYGNVGTDLSMDTLTAAGFEVGDVLKVEITGREPITLPLGTGYSNVDQGSPLALADADSNTLALAINRGDFATTYGLGVKGEDKTYAITPGVTITVSMAQKGGYLDEMEIRELDSKRTNVREDYASDEVFANFRAVTMGDIADGMLYRTSSPVNPELGRNTYADAFLKAAGVKTVVNLADSKETMEAYEGYADTYYSTLKVIPLNMGVDMYSDDAKAALKAGLEFIIANEGPYAFHCTEGKDRAGYFAMLLEALMGAKPQEIVTDYMLSFENYYHVANRTEQWMKIAESNIEKDLVKLAGVESVFDLDGVDLSAAAGKYMVEELGLTAEQVSGLKAALSGK